MPDGSPPLAAASGGHVFADAVGGTVSSGEAEFRVFADRLQVAPRGSGSFDVEFLDVDSVGSSDYTVGLSLWPEGKLSLQKLGRLWESFSAALLDARDDAVLHGALAHGLAEKARFDGALADSDPPVPAWLRIYPTHLAVMPRGGLPSQIPWGGVEEIRLEQSSYGVLLRSGSKTTRIGRLARKTEAFQRACEDARREQQDRIVLAVTPHLPPLSPIAAGRLTGSFQDGLGVAQAALKAAAPGSFAGLLERLASGERLERARRLAELARPGEARIGIVELLDAEPASGEGDGEGAGEARSPLGENLAAFLLAPLASAPAVALELLCGPAAATYVFRAGEGGIGAINADLQAIHFRRAVLALTDAQASGPAGRPYRLALRAVAEVARLRGAIAGRLVHGRGDFESSLEQALAKTR